ncbi:MAG: RNA polymerase sigma factor [Bacteroidota bacterium]|nr:RNA polymerase sigma factor [Candidatus Kapabacteria bacterium]MCS7302494.1 RNA polymerase sigma factor [Candidatus Kapabacteria bacterium]MCX7937271.1 RNA polymerase sigma factor [Chlorobiota bacterium]MDW8075534.1 RNA polymerase sigma factor [Bacteroidota bacterium]MDW8271788.1 RNA polymerase sigma factor [Bacteroidota bacterium]
MAQDYSGLSDSELYSLLSQPDHREAAFGELYRRYSHRVFVYCRKILGNSHDADDAFQETFIKLLGSASPKRQMTNFPAFLLTIARNTCRDMLAVRHREHVELIEELHGVACDFSVEQNEINQLITMALDLLPFEWREAIVLQLYANMSYSEIAEAMGVPVTTVRNWICRGKQRLREILQPYFDERDVRSAQ